MTRTLRTLLIALAALAAGASACDPLAAPDYPGEPLLQITGTVENALSNPPPTEIALAWLVPDPDFEFAFHPEATTVPVEGEFPAGFTMRLYHPPPLEVLDTPVESELEGRLAIGFILALREGASRDLINLRAEDLLGVSDEHVLVYFDGDVDTSPIRGLRQGYQLLPVFDDDSPQRQAADQCFDEVFDQLIGCEDACFFTGEGCFNQCEQDNQGEPCLLACDDALNGCLDACFATHEPELNQCNELANTFEPAPADALTVRMFDNASAEEIWSYFRPEDCEAAFAANAECVNECAPDDDACFVACEEAYTAFSCGPPLGRCEAIYQGYEACFAGCIDQEGACRDNCFGDGLCEDSCFETTGFCFDDCELEFNLEQCEDGPPRVEVP